MIEAASEVTPALPRGLSSVWEAVQGAEEAAWVRGDYHRLHSQQEDALEEDRSTESSILRQGGTIRHIHRYFSNFEASKCCLNLAAGQPAYAAIRVVRNTASSVAKAKSVMTSQPTYVAELSNQEFCVFRKALLCAQYPLLSAPDPPQSPSPAGMTRGLSQGNLLGFSKGNLLRRSQSNMSAGFPPLNSFAFPPLSNVDEQKLTSGDSFMAVSGSTSAVSLEEGMAAVPAEMLCDHLMKVFQLTPQKFAEYENMVAEAYCKPREKILYEELSCQLVQVEDGKHPYYTHDAFVWNAHGYTSWREQARTRLGEKLSRLGLGSAVQPGRKRAETGDHRRDYRALMDRLLSYERDLRLGLARPSHLYFPLSSASHRLLTEFAQRYGVEPLYHHLVFLNCLADDFDNEIWFIQKIIAVMTQIEQMLPRNRKNAVIVKDELSILQQTLHILYRHCENSLSRTHRLFLHSDPAKGVAGLIEILEKVLKLKRYISTPGEVVPEMKNLLVKYQKTEVQTLYERMKLISAEELQLSAQDTTVTPTLVNKLIIGIRQEVEETQETFGAVFSKYCQIGRVSAQLYYDLLMEDVVSLTEQHKNKLMSNQQGGSLDLTMLSLAYRLNRLDQDWQEYIPHSSQSWRDAYVEHTLHLVDTVGTRALPPLVKQTIAADTFKPLTFQDGRQHGSRGLCSSTRSSASLQSVGSILTPSDRSAFSKVIAPFKPKVSTGQTLDVANMQPSSSAFQSYAKNQSEILKPLNVVQNVDVQKKARLSQDSRSSKNKQKSAKSKLNSNDRDSDILSFKSLDFSDMPRSKPLSKSASVGAFSTSYEDDLLYEEDMHAHSLDDFQYLDQNESVAQFSKSQTGELLDDVSEHSDVDTEKEKAAAQVVSEGKWKKDINDNLTDEEIGDAGCTSDGAEANTVGKAEEIADGKSMYADANRIDAVGAVEGCDNVDNVDSAKNQTSGENDSASLVDNGKCAIVNNECIVAMPTDDSSASRVERILVGSDEHLEAGAENTDVDIDDCDNRNCVIVKEESSFFEEHDECKSYIYGKDIPGDEEEDDGGEDIANKGEFPNESKPVEGDAELHSNISIKHSSNISVKHSNISVKHGENIAEASCDNKTSRSLTAVVSNRNSDNANASDENNDVRKHISGNDVSASERHKELALGGANESCDVKTSNIKDSASTAEVKVNSVDVHDECSVGARKRVLSGENSTTNGNSVYDVKHLPTHEREVMKYSKNIPHFLEQPKDTNVSTSPSSPHHHGDSDEEEEVAPSSYPDLVFHTSWDGSAGGDCWQADERRKLEGDDGNPTLRFEESHQQQTVRQEATPSGDLRRQALEASCRSHSSIGREVTETLSIKHLQISSSLLDMMVVLQRFIRLVHTLCGTLYPWHDPHQGHATSHVTDHPTDHVTDQVLQQHAVNRWRIYEVAIKAVTSALQLYTDNVLWVDLCGVTVKQAQNIFTGEKLLVDLVAVKQAGRVWGCRHMTATPPQSCDHYVGGRRGGTLAGKHEPIELQMLLRVNDLFDLQHLSQVILSDLRNAVDLDSVTHIAEKFCLPIQRYLSETEESELEQSISSTSINIGDCQPQSHTHRWLQHLDMCRKAQLNLIAYRLNLFLSDAVTLFLEKTPQSAPMAIRLQPVVQFLLNHVGFFRKHLLRGNVTRLMRKVWICLSESLKTNIEVLRETSIEQRKAIQYHNTVQCLLRVMSQQAGVALTFLTSRVSGVVFLVRLYQLGSQELVEVAAALRTQEAASVATSSSSWSRPSESSADSAQCCLPDHYVRAMQMALHQYRKCFTGRHLVDYMRTNPPPGHNTHYAVGAAGGGDAALVAACQRLLERRVVVTLDSCISDSASSSNTVTEFPNVVIECHSHTGQHHSPGSDSSSLGSISSAKDFAARKRSSEPARRSRSVPGSLHGAADISRRQSRLATGDAALNEAKNVVPENGGKMVAIQRDKTQLNQRQQEKMNREAEDSGMATGTGSDTGGSRRHSDSGSRSPDGGGNKNESNEVTPTPSPTHSQSTATQLDHQRHHTNSEATLNSATTKPTLVNPCNSDNIDEKTNSPVLRSSKTFPTFHAHKRAFPESGVAEGISYIQQQQLDDGVVNFPIPFEGLMTPRPNLSLMASRSPSSTMTSSLESGIFQNSDDVYYCFRSIVDSQPMNPFIQRLVDEAKEQQVSSSFVIEVVLGRAKEEPEVWQLLRERQLLSERVELEGWEEVICLY